VLYLKTRSFPQEFVKGTLGNDFRPQQVELAFNHYFSPGQKHANDRENRSHKSGQVKIRNLGLNELVTPLS
jgi:hypothetical protein